MSTSQVEEERGHIENDKLRNKWNSCCFTCDKDFVKYFVQTGFLAGASVLAIAMLLLGSEPQSLWISVLSSSVGLVIPSPIFK